MSRPRLPPPAHTHLWAPRAPVQPLCPPSTPFPDPGPPHGSPARRLIQLGAHCKHAALAHRSHGHPALVVPPKPARTLPCSPAGPALSLLVNTHAHPVWGRHRHSPPPAAGTRRGAVTSAHRPISWHGPTGPLQHPRTLRLPASPFAKSQVVAVS